MKPGHLRHLPRACALLACITLFDCSDRNKPGREEALSQIQQLVERDGEVKLYTYFADTKYAYLNGFSTNSNLYNVVASVTITVTRSRSEMIDVMRRHPDYFPEGNIQAMASASDLFKGNVIKHEMTCSFLKTEKGWLIQPSEACGSTKPGD